MANIWLIADTHFGHANMLKFKRADNVTSVRPEFASVQEMDEIIIERWNKVVKPNDKVYHLGDIMMGSKAGELAKYMLRLHGKKRLIRGNHDDCHITDYLMYFDEVYASRRLDRLLLTHIPIAPWNIGKHSANVHGHVHQSQPMVYTVKSQTMIPTELGYPIIESRVTYVNLSVEMINYTPVALEYVNQHVAKFL